jgi:hypothetical protein
MSPITGILFDRDAMREAAKSAVPPRIVKALQCLLQYLEPDEQAHYEQTPLVNRNGHIYRDLRRVKAWLRDWVPLNGGDYRILQPSLDDSRPAKETDAEDDCDSTPEFFGGCPVCLSNNGYLNIGRNHWFYCTAHRVKWNRGENLFSTWRMENEEDWRKNQELLTDYETVQPVFPPWPEEEAK